MLQSIRDRTQGWMAGVIISLLILSFALWGIHSYIIGATNTGVVAKVNGVQITKMQLASAFERLRRQAQVNIGSLTNQTEEELKHRSLQALINLQVMKQASIAERYRVSSHQVNSFLESMPEFQVNGKFSLDRFQQLLATTLYNAGDFLELIETTLLIDQPRLGILFSSFALPEEINDSIALVNQERDINYVILPMSSVPKSEITISPAEINDYYQQHQEEFKTPAQAAIEYIELSVKDLMAGVESTAETIKSYYDENINSYTIPMQWTVEKIFMPVADSATEEDLSVAKKKAEEVAAKAQSGTNFAMLSRDFGQDNADYKLEGWLTLDRFPSDVQKDIAALKANEISKAIPVKNGFIIIKVTGYKAAEVQPFEKVSDKVKEAYARQQAEERFAEAREKLASVTYEYPDSLAPAAKALGLKVKQSGSFTQNKPATETDITANKKVREVAFSEDVLNSQNNSDIIQISPDTAVVIRVKSHVPASALSLEATQNQIIEKLKAEKMANKLADLANQLKAKLANGQPADQVLQSYHLNWNQLGYIGRFSKNVDAAVLDEAFRMVKPQEGHSSFATVKTHDGYAIIMLKAFRDGTTKANPEQYEIFAEQVQNSEGQLEYKLYELSLRNKAKIVMENPAPDGATE